MPETIFTLQVKKIETFEGKTIQFVHNLYERCREKKQNIKMKIFLTDFRPPESCLGNSTLKFLIFLHAAYKHLRAARGVCVCVCVYQVLT